MVALYGDRSTTSALTSLLNPQVPSGMVITLSQNLLNGFGYRANASSLRIARNDLKLTDSVFRQQVITTIAQVVNLYSDLLYYRENVRVAEEALKWAQTQLKDNTRQVEIGKLAAIEITQRQVRSCLAPAGPDRCPNELPSAGRNLENRACRSMSTPIWRAWRSSPRDKLPEPKPNDIPSLQEALTEAVKNRPEIEQAQSEHAKPGHHNSGGPQQIAAHLERFCHLCADGTFRAFPLRRQSSL